MSSLPTFLFPRSIAQVTSALCRSVLLVICALSASMMSAMPAQAQDDTTTYTCIPAIKIVADLGYCFGFSLSYFDAINDTSILGAIEEKGIAANIASAHQQCYATDFSTQQTLGALAFSSYINLKDDALLTRTAADCRIMLDYYAKQRNTSK